MACYGTWVGWLILRYFAPNVHNRYEKGNGSDEFALDMLFPPILRFPVRAIGGILYAIFENLGCCGNAGHMADDGRQSNKNQINDNLNDLVLNLAQRGGTDSDS